MAVPQEVENQYDSVTINSNKFWFKCEYTSSQKARLRYRPSFLMTLIVFSEKHDKFLTHKEMVEEGYAYEKIQEYIKNTVNGQRTLSFNPSNPRKFD
jgi:hypothetical protein